MKTVFKNVFVRLSILVFCVFFAVMFITLGFKRNELLAKTAELENKIEEAEERVDRIRSELDKPFDDDSIEEIAREKLGMRYPQEVVFYSGDGN